MADITQIPNFYLKIVFIVHTLFISLVCMGYWVNNSYLFYNSLLIFLLLWAIHVKDANEPVQLALVIDALAVILDVLFLCFCFPASDHARETFSAAMAILHLLARPFLILTLHQKGREGSVLATIFAGGARNETYEDIDRGAPANPPHAQASYDFNTAQQI